jgi:hypothetical protein
MPFMKPQVYQGEYYEVTAGHGETWIVPVDATGFLSGFAQPASSLQDYVEPDIDDPDEILQPKRGWLARMSAPGYLDCTDWSAHDSEQEAREYLDEMYGEDA